ncbi:MAG: hypothetical protein BMS9Abin34_229 [Patescibacteria group bacterium]|nr:MAG: hypothetical protein BMS9Abin34_229 [Patescibacteria group bacterium]
MQKTKGRKLKIETKARACGRYLKVSPTKVRDLMDLIRGRSLTEAETVLKFSGRRGAQFALKVLHSAVANAGSALDRKSWVVTEARADKGPIFRRRLDPKPRGARGLITANSTHLTIAIGSRVEETSPPRAGRGESSAKRKRTGAKNAA